MVHLVHEEPYVAVVPADHALAHLPEVDARQLAPYALLAVRRDTGPVTFDRLVAYFTRAGEEPRFVQCANTSPSLVGLVAAGLGVAIVIRSLSHIVRNDLRFIPLAGEPPRLGLGICHERVVHRQVKLSRSSR